MLEYKKIATSVALLSGIVNAVSPSLQTSASFTSFLKKAGSIVFSAGNSLLKFVGVFSLISFIKNAVGSGEKHDYKNETKDNDSNDSNDSTDDSSEGSDGTESNIKINKKIGENVENEIILVDDKNEGKKKAEELDLNEKCMEIFNSPEKFEWRLESVDGKNQLYVNIDGKGSFISASRVFAKCKETLEKEKDEEGELLRNEKMGLEHRKYLGVFFTDDDNREKILNRKISICSFMQSVFDGNCLEVLIDLEAAEPIFLSKKYIRFLENFLGCVFDTFPSKENSRNLSQGFLNSDFNTLQANRNPEAAFADILEPLRKISEIYTTVKRKVHFLVSEYGKNWAIPEIFVKSVIDHIILEVEEDNNSGGDNNKLSEAERQKIFSYIKGKYPELCENLTKGKIKSDVNKSLYSKYLDFSIEKMENKEMKKENTMKNTDVKCENDIFKDIGNFNWKVKEQGGKKSLFVDTTNNGNYMSAGSYFSDCKKKLQEDLKDKSEEELNKVIKEQTNNVEVLSYEKTLKQKIEDDIDICNFMIFASVDNPWGVVNMKSPSLINFSTPFFRNLSEFFRISEEKKEEKKKDKNASSFLGNVILGEKFRSARLVRNWAINKVSNNGERQFSEIEVVQKIVSRYKKEKNDELLNVKNCIDDGLGYSTTEMYNDFKQFLKDMKLEDELRDLEKSEEDDNVVKKRLKDLEDFEKQYRNSNKNT